MYNLLADPIITVKLTDGGRSRASLPELFVLLEENRVAGYAHLLPYQRHPWHALCVQLACLALEEADLPAPGESPCLLGRHDRDWWAGALRRLTPGYEQDEPWALIVGDIARPAFLQTPVVDGPLADWTKLVKSPDDLDVLVTAKNHGVKQTRMNAPAAEDWLFALVSTQTQGGYDGRGLYGIARMNGGYGTRPGFSLVPGPAPGGQWARDARVILDNLDDISPDIFNRRHPRRALLWLDPWDGATSWPLADLHPLFVEICRRFRLEDREGTILASYKATACARLDAKNFNGVVGDPWMPFQSAVDGQKSYASALTYRNICAMLGTGKYRRPLLLESHPCDPPSGMAAQCRILLRGQGKTEGYQERVIPIHGSVDLLSKDSTKNTAATMVSLADKAEGKVLRPALKIFLQDRSGKDSVGIREWIQALDRAVDEIFFPSLWDMLERQESGQDGCSAEQPWIDKLRTLTKKYFAHALSALPCAAAYRLRAEAEAWIAFNKLRAKELPLAKS
ncbi:MAG: hypothetical protein LBO77_00480 [Desulfovibrio sp.]|nr:hypothetical protein [Desulfovibrio sp.]